MAKVIPIHHGPRGLGLAPGQTFAGRYCLVKRLGAGGMGEVWLAGDQKITRMVALKVMHRSLLQIPGYEARFRHESWALAQLDCPWVVSLYDWGTEPQPFIVMKRIAGKTLREILRQEAPQPWTRSVCFAIYVAVGLSAMHRGKLWHRDVKPDNVMVDEEGNVTLLDLGIVRDARSGGDVTAPIGSAGYLPPEMVLRLKADHRGDLYSLGVTLYELLTGQKPYSGFDPASETEMQAAHAYAAPDPLREHAPHCPEVLEAIVMRLLAKSPEDRYASAREVAADLSDVLRAHGSVLPGDPLAPLVDQVLARRKLTSLTEAPPKAKAEAEPTPKVEATLELSPGFVARNPAARPMRQDTTEPMGEQPRKTMELGNGFVVQSPASPAALAMAAARAIAAVAEMEADAEAIEDEVAPRSRICGYYPAAVVPAAVTPVQTPGAVLPEERALFRRALPRSWQRREVRWLAGGAAGTLVLGAAMGLGYALGARWSRAAPVPVVSTAPAVSVAPVPAPAPAVVTTAPTAATVPAATASAATVPAATASASAPAPRTKVVRQQPTELVE